MTTLTDLMQQGRKVEQHRPWPRAVVDVPEWNIAVTQLAEGHWRLLGV